MLIAAESLTFPHRYSAEFKVTSPFPIVSLFPRTILFCCTGPTMPKHGSMDSISLKSHHSSDPGRCLQCTDTPSAVICACTEGSVLCQGAPDPGRIPVAKPWQGTEDSHSFSSLHQLAKGTSCSSGLSRAPGQKDYFFPGSYTPITLSALSINKAENPQSKQG